MEFYGVKLIGINAHTGEKAVLTLVLFAVFVLLRLILKSLSRVAFANRHGIRPHFWARQGIDVGTTIVLMIGLLSIWFDNPANLATGVGLASAGLAFALQQVITSFAGYLVILRCKTFNVGDRITMGGVRGDVIALGFIQTTIMEMGEPPLVQSDAPGMWVMGRQFTGRIVTVTNGRIFDQPVYNYSRDFPLIWEEMHLPVTYTCDRVRAEQILLEAARTHTEGSTEAAREALQTAMRRYTMPEVELEPRVFFRITDNWLELGLRFLSPAHGARAQRCDEPRYLYGLRERRHRYRFHNVRYRRVSTHFARRSARIEIRHRLDQWQRWKLKGQLGRLQDALAGNLWLVPLIAFVAVVVLARGFLAFDQSYGTRSDAWFVYGGSPSGARQLLSTIAGSMITFIGMVFSSTIVVLQLASSQYSPRVLRSFFRDRVIQTALGTFIATFAYAILVLREVHEEAGHAFVPGLSVYVGISFVWLSLATFVVYLNHIVQRIRPITIVAIAAAETRACLASLAAEEHDAALFVRPAAQPQEVVAANYGLFASVDEPAILALAERTQAIVEVLPLAGDFVRSDATTMLVWVTPPLGNADLQKLARCISLERERTMREDPLFGFRQLVDVADKALSPGINDPTTAVQVLDQIHDLLYRFAEALPLRDVYCDGASVPRVFVPRPSWDDVLRIALEEILLYGSGSLHVMRRMRELVIDLEAAVAPPMRPALGAFLRRIDDAVDAKLGAADRESVRRTEASTIVRERRIAVDSAARPMRASAER